MHELHYNKMSSVDYFMEANGTKFFDTLEPNDDSVRGRYKAENSEQSTNHVFYGGDESDEASG
uniref:Uncharacterized protein n=1 Tax=viral metagenome TaxID=1070528 RepID=A0A6M3IH43_9ZZZZ